MDSCGQVRGVIEKWPVTRLRLPLKSFTPKYATPDVTTVWLDGAVAKDCEQVIQQQVQWLSSMKALPRYDVKVESVPLTGRDRAEAVTLYDISWGETDAATRKTRREEAKGSTLVG